jgi:hypothetical protein
MKQEEEISGNYHEWWQKYAYCMHHAKETLTNLNMYHLSFWNMKAHILPITADIYIYIIHNQHISFCVA